MSIIKYSLCFLWLCVWLLIISVSRAFASSPSEIKEVFPQLEIDKSIFTTAELHSQVKIFRSRYSNRPEGVEITYKLDLNKRYLISISGQSYKIKPVLGIRINGTPDRIFRAPNGEIFLNAFNTPK